jgi:hypothetical protein
MSISYNNLIVDFERINSLTSHPNDNPSTQSLSGGTFVYSITRKLLRDYLEIYLSYNQISQRSIKVPDEEYNKVCEILLFNKVLISKSDIRDNRINDILSYNDEFDNSILN